jgi:hypothetical protein
LSVLPLCEATSSAVYSIGEVCVDSGEVIVCVKYELKLQNTEKARGTTVSLRVVSGDVIRSQEDQ